MGKASGLLKGISIVYIVFGIIALIVSLMAMAGSAFVASLGIDELAGVGFSGVLIIASVIAIIESVIMLLAGIFGVKGAKLSLCFVFGIIILALGAISIIMSAVGGTFAWTSIIGIVLSVLYIWGVKQSQ